MISLAITTYNRPYQEIEPSFLEAVHFGNAIDEIVIVDDHSPMHVYADICSRLRISGFYKRVNIQLYRNDANIGMASNKKRAISLCKNDHVIIFDSDNRITNEYLSACVKHAYTNIDTIYCPGFARPHFNYLHFDEITSANAREMAAKPQFDCLINTCNYMVAKNRFVEICQPDTNIEAADSALFFYQWLKAVNKFKVIHEMQYDHLVHEGSGFLQNVDKNIEDINKIIEKIKAL